MATYPEDKRSQSKKRRHSLSIQISPRALKLHRTIPYSSSNHRPIRSPDRLSTENATPLIEQTRRERNFESSKCSPSFSDPSVNRKFTNSNSSTSTRETGKAHSDSPPCKVPSWRTCSICEKSSGTDRNWMAACLGCNRTYHNNCRKPPLIHGANPQCWRCWKCLSEVSGQNRSRFDASHRSRTSTKPWLNNNDSAPKSVSKSKIRSHERMISSTPSAIVFSDNIYEACSPRTLGHNVSQNGPNSVSTLGILVPRAEHKNSNHTLNQPQLVPTRDAFTCSDERPPERRDSLLVSMHHQNEAASVGACMSAIPRTSNLFQTQSSIDPQSIRSASKKLSSGKLEKPQSARAIKSVSTKGTPTRPRMALHQDRPFLTESLPGHAVAPVYIDFMPFERAEVCKQRTSFNLHKITQVKNFREIEPRRHQSLIEFMTKEEKAKKITEIKKRRSRKTFFGPDHKLAHVWRYLRKDIHDEKDGTWKPSPRKVSRGSWTREMEESNDIRTLRKVLDLPEMVVPINEGRTELSFRAVTLTNGRPSQSRATYRVGKMFCGELTVRTS